MLPAATGTTVHFFLFDEQHPDLENGPSLYPSAQRVVAALERLDPVPTTRLIWGSVITYDGSYRLASLKVGGNSSTQGAAHRSHGTTYEPDYDMYKTVVCDLAEALSAPPSTVVEEQLLVYLAQGAVWAVGCSHTSDDQAFSIDQELRRFGPYLGMVKPDLGNPLHRRMLIDIMFHKDIVFSPSGITYRVEPWLDPEDQKEGAYLARQFGSSKPPVGVDGEEFEALLPPLSFPEKTSQRGELTIQRLAKKGEVGARERLARAIFERFQADGSDMRLVFSTAKAEGVRDFDFDERKFVEYLLNREHPKGGGKAKFFVDRLGIEPSDWRFLADQIERGMATAPFYKVNPTEWGFSHGAYVLVTGRNGKTAVLETGWVITSGGSAKFVTAYPYDGNVQESLAELEPFVIRTDLSGHERWAALFERAVREAGKAAAEALPTPMVIQGFGTEWEGMCGFGWAHLPNARDPMAKWLLKNDHGDRAYPGVKVWSQADTQSWERNRAWARGFAAVLEANGVKCSAGDRLD